MTASTVLVVEADILVRYPLAQYLRECGYQVLEAADVSEARTLLSLKDIAIDIALVDATGIGEQAFALAQELRHSTRQIEIVLTGSLNKTVAEARDLCEDGPALAKPYNHQAVLDLIQRLLAARRRREAKA